MKKPQKRQPTLEELESKNEAVLQKKAKEAKEIREENKTWWNSKTRSQKTSFIVSCILFAAVLVWIFL